MSWFRIDDKSAFHRKVLKAGNEAWGAICRAGAVSAGEGTDGRVTKETMLAIAPMKVWQRAITAGLVEQAEQGSFRLAFECCGYIDTRTTWSRSAYQSVYERDVRCRYCGADDRLTIDHVVPRCQGGRDDESNLVVACRSCNSRKGGRTPKQAGMVLL